MFPCNKRVPPGVNGRQCHPKCVAYVQSTRFFFVLVSENSASPRQDVRNGNRLFSAVVAISGYSALTLIQNPGRVVVLKILLKPPSFRSPAVDLLLTEMLDSPCLLISGSRTHSW